MLSEQEIKLTRYTITGDGASPGCFRLVEDKHGAWMQSAEVDVNLLALRAENTTLKARLSEARSLLVQYAPMNDDGNVPCDVENFLHQSLDI